MATVYPNDSWTVGLVLQSTSRLRMLSRLSKAWPGIEELRRWDMNAIDRGATLQNREYVPRSLGLSFWCYVKDKMSEVTWNWKVSYIVASTKMEGAVGLRQPDVP